MVYAIGLLEQSCFTSEIRYRYNKFPVTCVILRDMCSTVRCRDTEMLFVRDTLQASKICWKRYVKENSSGYWKTFCMLYAEE